MLLVFTYYGEHIATHRKYKNAKKTLGKLKVTGYILAEESPIEEKRIQREQEALPLYKSLDNLLSKKCLFVLKSCTDIEKIEKVKRDIKKVLQRIKKIETETSLENWYH